MTVARVVLWHNPRCSKSRQARALLDEAGCEIEERLYLEQPPDVEELRRVLALLGMSARALARRGEDAYRELGLADADEDTTLRALCDHPSLIERPIAIFEGPPRAALGRPPARVIEVMDQRG
jgi:arsenate reductase